MKRQAEDRIEHALIKSQSLQEDQRPLRPPGRFGCDYGSLKVPANNSQKRRFDRAMGGDEFVILTIGSKDENTDIMFERINDAISEHNLRSHKPYELACSIGVTPIDLSAGRSLEAIIADADKAIYAEKRRRKAAREEADKQDLLDPLKPNPTFPKDATGSRPSL